jgi:hypothetical protein
MVESILKTRKVDIRSIIFDLIDAEYKKLEMGDMGEIVLFEKKKRFKPEMDDKIVNNVRRFREITSDENIKSLCNDPEPLEYIRYVICEEECKVDFAGRNNKSNKSDRTYYTSIAKNVDYIDAITSLFSTCAQFLSYDFGKSDDKASVCRDLAKKYIEDRYKNYELNIPVYLDKHNINIRIKKMANIKIYKSWVSNYYRGNVLKTLLILGNCSVKPMEKILNLAELNKIPVDIIGCNGLNDIKNNHYNELIKLEFKLNCINRKMLMRYNSVLRKGMDKPDDFGDILNDDDKKCLYEVYKYCILYATSNSMCTSLSKKNTVIMSLSGCDI